MTREERLIELNGYLKSLSILNSSVNDSKTYFIKALLKALPKVNDNIQDTIRAFFNVTQWIVSAEKQITNGERF